MAAKNKIKATPRANTPSFAGQEVTPLNLKQIITSDKVYILALALIAFLLYILSVNNGYNLDDDLVTKDHHAVSKGISGIPEILTSPYYDKGDYRMDYRPVAQITYAIEQSLFGQSPGISHFVNVFLYALLCVTLFLLLRYIFPQVDRGFLWLGSLIFTVHPLHAEVVNNLKSRDELFSLLFGLLFIWMFVRDMRTPAVRFKLWSVVFLVLSLMSKVSVLPLLLFLPVYVLFTSREKWLTISVWIRPAFYILFWLVYFLVMTTVAFPTVRTLTFTEMPLPADPALKDHLNVIIPSIFFYVKMMIAPYPLSSYYGFNTMPPEAYKTLVVLIFIGVSAFLFFRGFRQRRFYALLVAWFFASGFLFFNIGYHYAGIVSERAAFIMSIPGSLGVAMLIGAVLQRKDISMIAPSRPVTYAVYGVALIYGLISFIRVGDWKDPVTLYAKDLQYYPNSGHLNFLQGVNYDIKSKETKDAVLQRKYVDTAYFHFNRALALQPDRPVALTYIGRYFIDYYSNLDTAHVLLSRAWEERESGETAYELGRVKTFLGRWDEALPILEQATVLDTSIYWTWYFLAQAYYEQGDFNKALAANENLKDIPEMSEYYHLNAGNFFYRSGRLEESMPWFRKAVENGTRDPRLLQEMRAYYTSKNDQAALQWLNNLPPIND